MLRAIVSDFSNMRSMKRWVERLKEGLTAAPEYAQDDDALMFSAGVLAAANFLAFSGMLASLGILWLLLSVFAFTPAQVFFICGVATIAGTIYVLTLLPQQMFRLLFWIFTNTIYRVRVEGGVAVVFPSMALCQIPPALPHPSTIIRVGPVPHVAPFITTSLRTRATCGTSLRFAFCASERTEGNLGFPP